MVIWTAPTMSYTDENISLLKTHGLERIGHWPGKGKVPRKQFSQWKRRVGKWGGIAQDLHWPIRICLGVWRVFLGPLRGSLGNASAAGGRRQNGFWKNLLKGEFWMGSRLRKYSKKGKPKAPCLRLLQTAQAGNMNHWMGQEQLL